jgi:hypothetical protein
LRLLHNQVDNMPACHEPNGEIPENYWLKRLPYIGQESFFFD